MFNKLYNYYNTLFIYTRKLFVNSLLNLILNILFYYILFRIYIYVYVALRLFIIVSNKF